MTGRPGRRRATETELRRVVSLAGPWRRDLVYGAVSGLAQQLLFLSGAAIVAYAAGRVVRGARYGSVSGWLLIVVVLVLPQVRTPWLEAVSFQAVANRVQVSLRARIYRHLAELAPAGLSGRRSGELAYTAMSDVEIIRRFFGETLSTLIVAAAAPVLALLAVAVLAWPLAVALVPLLAATAAVPTWIHTRSEHRDRGLPDEVADLSAELVDSVQGLREIVSFGAEDAVLADLDERAETVRHLQAVHDRRVAAEALVSDLLAAAGPLLALVLGGVLVAHRLAAPALLPPAVVLGALAFGPIDRLGRAAKTLDHVADAGERIFALLAAPVPVPQPSPGTADGALEPSVGFDRVSFRYGAEQPDVLRDITFEAPRGSTIALVGPSGAGKTTCARLLLRFWDPTDGAVTLGGTDLRALTATRLHRNIGHVPQDVYLFHTTIRDNLRLGRPDATDDRIEAAARAAQAWEFIAALPDGLDSTTGERGVQLSGGQRQRLAIARVLVADPPVVVLDEPVSNLDAGTERELLQAMRRLRSGRTTVVIAHRLSTTRDADRIVVLEDGSVVEAGTHEELVASHGPYARLVADQLLRGATGR